MIDLLFIAVLIILALGTSYLAYERLLNTFVSIRSWISNKLLKRYVVVTDNIIIYCYAYSKNDCFMRHYRNYGSKLKINTIERIK